MNRRASLYQLLLPTMVLVGSCSAQISNFESYDAADAVCTPQKRIYLNRWGGTYSPGKTDSRTNTSARLSQETEINEIEFEDDDWNLIKNCVADVYTEFDFEVTDNSPSADKPHLEVVFTRNESLGVLGFEGIKSAGGEEFQCEPDPNMIGWVFSHENRGNLDYCHRAVSAIATSLTLSLTTGCGDVTSSVSLCNLDEENAFSITNESRECERGTCRCDQNNTSQNAYQLLTSVLTSEAFCSLE